MSLAPEAIARLEETVNRLASECVLATAGKDDGLIPAFSLLTELAGGCADAAALIGPVTEMRAALERRLDAGQPFDQPTLDRLRRFVEWFPDALTTPAAAGPAPDAAGSGPAGPAAAAAPTEEADGLLEFALEENRELLGEFQAEGMDHLQQIEAALLALESNPDDQESLNSVFRSFHTIKGNAGFLGLRPMQRLAHEVETLLDLARDRRLRLTPALITEILRSRDAIQTLLGQVVHALEHGQMPSVVVPVGALIRSVKACAAHPGGEPATAVPTAAPTASTPGAGVQPAAPAAPADLTPPPIAPAPTVAGPEEGAAPRAPAAAAHTVRVNTEKLDTLMDVVGELVIVQSQLRESARDSSPDGSPLQRNVALLGRIAKELQATAMSLRMIVIKPTFQKMERLVRDLARDCGKKVSFVTEGDETELDRTVVEELADPLVHMVRNAVDHGLELPADRLARGKAETGTVRLSAYHEGNHIVVELRDDGRGIDPAKVLAKARAQGLVPANAEPTREEILRLIFMPGFSTAEKVTALSGRGVGMDVVKRNIERLRGRVEISSELGAGSIFKIKLPLTTAIIDGLVVKVGDDRFIIPSTSVQVALRPAQTAISLVQGTGELLNLKGRILPLHRLGRRLGVTARAEEPWHGIVLVVEAAGHVCALLVDEMVSKQEVVIKNLGGCLGSLPGVAGAAILGDGNIALILDPGTLLRAA